MKLSFYREDWSALPASLKATIRGRMAAEIDSAISSLTNIRSEIGTIAD